MFPCINFKTFIVSLGLPKGIFVVSLCSGDMATPEYEGFLCFSVLPNSVSWFLNEVCETVCPITNTEVVCVPLPCICNCYSLTRI